METTLNDRAAGNIRAELARRKITQEQFARRVGCSRTVLTALLGGQTQITLPRLEAIAAALEVPPAKLLAD